MIYRGHSHKRDKKHNDTQYWSCTSKGCHGRLHTVGLDHDVVFSHAHSCVEDDTRLIHGQVKSQLAQLAIEKPTQSLKQVYEEFVAQHFANSHLVPPTYEGCKSQMHRARRALHPAQPTCAADVHLEGVWRTEGGGSDIRLLLHQSAEMLIFCGDDHLKCMSSCETLLMDGTFKVAPSIYTQV